MVVELPSNKISIKIKKLPKKLSPQKASKKCPEGKVLNPMTGRCVDKNGKKGKEILNMNK